MGGTLSNRHAKPRKNVSVPRNSPSKSSPSKNSLSKSSTSPPFKTPPIIKPSDPLRPLPRSFTTPIQDSNTSNQDRRVSAPRTSNKQRSTSNQAPARASKQDFSSSIKDPTTSKQDPVTPTQDVSTSIQDPSTSKQDPVTPTQDLSTSKQDSITSNPDPNESEWKNHAENELENLLISKLDKAYNEALSRLIALGYQKRNALRAILSSGHCQGHFDLLTNILKNSIKYLTYPNEKAVTFSSLRQLEEHSLSDLISSLQKLRPAFSRPDAMRYLLAHELHVGEVTGTKLAPTIPTGTGLFKPIQSTLNAPPQLVEESGTESEEKLDSSTREPITEDPDEEEIDMETLHDLIHHIYELGTQVSEIKEWAQEKALQAAKKLGNDLVELRVLRMEKENGERMQNVAEAKISDMEKSVEELEKEVKRTAEELESVQMEVKRLEMEKKEIQAEMEAARLSGADSSKACKRLEKKVKRLDKNCEDAERQKAVLKDELAEIKRKKKEVQDELDALRNTIREFKIKLNEEIRMKEQAKKLAEAERKATELAKVNSKKKLQFIMNKHELDTRRHSDQVEVLKCEIARLNEAIFSSPSSSSKLCRPCIFCETAEASMVFLPCRHEVLCSGCGKDYEDIGSDRCPACNVKIEETVYIYGLSSS